MEVETDIRHKDWFDKLKKSGFVPDFSTVWALEGSTLLLADFMNKPSATLPNSVFHLYSDWPDQLFTLFMVF